MTWLFKKSLNLIPSAWWGQNKIFAERCLAGVKYSLQPWRKQISLIKLGKGDNAAMLEPGERISAQKIADRVY